MTIRVTESLSHLVKTAIKVPILCMQAATVSKAMKNGSLKPEASVHNRPTRDILYVIHIATRLICGEVP